MTLPGRKPRPEASPFPRSVSYLYPPSHRPEPERPQFDRIAPEEPDWSLTFPTPARRRKLAVGKAVRLAADSDAEMDDQLERCRFVAHRTWQLVVPDLESAGLLARCDRFLLEDLCVVTARLDQLERNLSTYGLQLRGRDGGLVKNPAHTQAKAYRDQLNRLVPEFGLSPSARTRLRVADYLTDDADGLFDFHDP